MRYKDTGLMTSILSKGHCWGCAARDSDTRLAMAQPMGIRKTKQESGFPRCRLKLVHRSPQARRSPFVGTHKGVLIRAACSGDVIRTDAEDVNRAAEHELLDPSLLFGPVFGAYPEER